MAYWKYWRSLIGGGIFFIIFGIADFLFYYFFFAGDSGKITNNQMQGFIYGVVIVVAGIVMIIVGIALHKETTLEDVMASTYKSSATPTQIVFSSSTQTEEKYPTYSNDASSLYGSKPPQNQQNYAQAASPNQPYNR
jgi:hypothetical protein